MEFGSIVQEPIMDILNKFKRNTEIKYPVGCPPIEQRIRWQARKLPKINSDRDSISFYVLRETV